MTDETHKKSWWSFLKGHRAGLLMVQFAAVFALGFAIHWALADRPPSTASDPAGAEDDHGGVKEWTCTMHLHIRSPRPGKCPTCRMDLVPVTTGRMRELQLSPSARKLMKIRTSPVERRFAKATIRMVGKVDYDETRLRRITAWVPGRLDRLYVDYTGIQVAKGDHLVYIYSEDLYTAQDELIQALKFARPRAGNSRTAGEINLVDAAREKLRLLGMTAEQIKRIETQSKPSDHMTVFSPISGIVIEKPRQEGDRVRVGDRIYTVADLSEVWVMLDAYESDLMWLRYGQKVEFTTEAYPGEQFVGRIAFIDPVLNKKTRTVKVRVNLPNSSGKLKPQMFVHAEVEAQRAVGGRVLDPDLAGKWISPMHPEIVRDKPGKCDICGMPLVRAESLGYVAPDAARQGRPLVIPVSAALVTGTRAVVYVQVGELEAAQREISRGIWQDNLQATQKAFSALEKVVQRIAGAPASGSDAKAWTQRFERLKKLAHAGHVAKKIDDARLVLDDLTKQLAALRARYGTVDEPEFYEGREIVLGPRAGNYYLVRGGVDEGELVVTHGNFKIDSALQIQARPSMMTPGGGVVAGHHHGSHKDAGDHKGPKQAAAQSEAPVRFHSQLVQLDVAEENLGKAIKTEEMAIIRRAFTAFGKALSQINGNMLADDLYGKWRERSMLLGADATEGSGTTTPAEAKRVFGLLKTNMNHLRAELGPKYKSFAAPKTFLAQLATMWNGYLAVGDALASDDLAAAQRSIAQLSADLTAVDAKALPAGAKAAWLKEHANLLKTTSDMRQATDIKSVREHFAALTAEFSALIRTFGIGDAGPVYELHCSMAFNNQGAIWLQNKKQTRNPYFGSTMLRCKDKIQLILDGELPTPKDSPPKTPTPNKKGHQHD